MERGDIQTVIVRGSHHNSRKTILGALANSLLLGLREQIQAGVRALFNGGSGTGKTYAARLLAAALQKDIYRLDLSTIINRHYRK